MCRALGVILWLAVSLCFSAGCAHPPIHGFGPVGPQGCVVIPMTAVKYKDLAGPHFLFAEGEEFTAGAPFSLFGEDEESTWTGPWGKLERRPITSEEFEADLTQLYADAIARRPNSPTFRALCGLLQRRFTQWRRLVLLERIDFASGRNYRGYYGEFYDFILIVVTPDGVTGATSLMWDGKHWFDSTSSACPQPLADNKEKIERCLSELARAREVLPQTLMWERVPSRPFLILHDIRVAEDGKPPMRHWASVVRESRVPEGRVPFRQDVDYGQAKWIPENFHHAVPYEFEERFHLAVDMYETLFARIWEAAVGPDGLDVETLDSRPETAEAERFMSDLKKAFPDAQVDP